MRKKVFGRKLNRNRKSRTILFRALSKSMVVHGSIKTTKAKALALQPRLDKLMILVSDGSLSARRSALAFLGNDREATSMLFEKYKALAASRNSGFTKMALVAPRRGDAAEMASLSWVEIPVEKVEPKEKKDTKKKAK